MLIAVTLNKAVQLNDQVCVFGGGAPSKGGSGCHNTGELLFNERDDNGNVHGALQARWKLHSNSDAIRASCMSGNVSD